MERALSFEKTRKIRFVTVCYVYFVTKVHAFPLFII